MENRRGKPPKGISQNRNAAGRGRAVPSKNPRPRPKGAESEISPGTVTLSQKQLDAIMDTVGSLVAENQLLQSKQLELDDNEAHAVRSEVSESILNLANKGRTSNGRSNSGHSFRGPTHVEPDEIPGLGKVDVARVPSSKVREMAPSSVPGLGQVNPPARPDIPKAHMTKAELKKLQWEQERAEVSKMPLSPGRSMTQYWSNEQIKIPSIEAPVSTPGLPKAHLTLAEKKRKQWEEERAENAQREAIFNQPAPQRARQPDVLEVNHASPTNQPPASIPKAHLTKAELKRLQWDRERVEMEKLNIHGSPSRDMSNNKDNGNVPYGDGRPYVPSFGMSKMEMKRQQWEKEREENADMDRGRGMVDQTSSALAIGGVGKSRPESNAPLSKAEMKRLQWEQEKVENADMERQQKRRDPSTYSNTRNGSFDEGIQETKRGLSKVDIKRQQWEKERVENEGFGSWQIEGNEQPRHGRRARAPSHDGGDSHYAHSATSPQVEAAPGSHLSTQGSKPISKGELKRRQWEKERQEQHAAEQQGEYDPWGRPGAGAPIRDPSGQVITDYNQRQVSDNESAPLTSQAEPLLKKWQY